MHGKRLSTKRKVCKNKNKSVVLQVQNNQHTMIETDIRELNEKIQRESQFLDLINLEMNKVIVGL